MKGISECSYEEFQYALSVGVTAPFYLSKLFKQETGMCFQDYVNQERVNRAADLLLFSDLSLPEIAHYVHFPNQSYFGKIFKKVKGISPGSYRDRYKNREV